MAFIVSKYLTALLLFCINELLGVTLLTGYFIRRNVVRVCYTYPGIRKAKRFIVNKLLLHMVLLHCKHVLIFKLIVNETKNNVLTMISLTQR